jgi:hypothetical protein
MIRADGVLVICMDQFGGAKMYTSIQDPNDAALVLVTIANQIHQKGLDVQKEIIAGQKEAIDQFKKEDGIENSTGEIETAPTDSELGKLSDPS